MPILKKVSWVLICVSAFNHLPYGVLVETYDENLAFHRYMLEKGEFFNKIFYFEKIEKSHTDVRNNRLDLQHP